MHLTLIIIFLAFSGCEQPPGVDDPPSGEGHVTCDALDRYFDCYYSELIKIFDEDASLNLELGSQIAETCLTDQELPYIKPDLRSNLESNDIVSGCQYLIIPAATGNPDQVNTALLGYVDCIKVKVKSMAECEVRDRKEDSLTP